MKHFFTLILALYITYPPANAQSLASLNRAFNALGYEPGLNYHSKFEAKVFENWETTNKVDRLDLLFAIDSNITEEMAVNASKKLDAIFLELNENGILEAHFKKQVKMIERAMRKHLFREYRDVATPIEAFTEKAYSNFSACALYAIAFDHYEVPYQVWTDAFIAAIVADPFGNLGPPIELEPLGITASIDFWSTDRQANYIGFLMGAGIVDKATIRKEGIEELFYKYYLPQEDIFFHEMVGMLYLQQGIQDRKRKEYRRSIEQLEKAFLFRPSYGIKYQLYQSRIEILAKPTYTNWQEVQDLISLYKLQPNANLRSVVNQSFVWMTKSFVYEKDSISYYDQIFQALTNEIEDEILEKELGYIYYQEKAQSAAKEGDFKEAIEYIQKVDTLPVPEDMQTRVTFYVGGYAVRLKSCAEKISFIEEVTTKYDFLSERNDLLSTLLNCRLVRMRDLLNENQEDKSLEQFSLIKKMLAENKDLVVDQNRAGETFSLASRYYLEKGDKVKAKEMFEWGMKHTNDYKPLLELQENFEDE